MWTIRLGVGYVVDANGQLSRWSIFDIIVPIYTQNWPLLLMDHVLSVVWDNCILFGVEYSY